MANAGRRVAREDVSKEVTFKQDAKLKGSRPREEQGRGRGGWKLSVDEGQHVQRPRKGTSPERLSTGEATEAVAVPREAGRGQVRQGPVGSGKSLDFLLQAKGSESLKNFKLGPGRS